MKAVDTFKQQYDNLKILFWPLASSFISGIHRFLRFSHFSLAKPPLASL